MVSIIITAYNVSKTIEKAVKSCLSQTYKNIEVVIVEDKSTDNTLEVCQKLLKSKRVHLYANKNNVGAGMARRIGIEKAKGDFVMFLDGDDYLGETFVKSLVEAQEKHDADFVTAGCTYLKKNGSYRVFGYNDGIFEGAEKITTYFGKETLFLNTSLVRRSLFEKAPYCHRRYIEDVSTALRLRFFANKVVYVDNPAYFYVQNPESLTNTSDEFKENLFRALAANDMVQFFNEHDPELGKACKFEEMYGKCVLNLKKLNPSFENVAKYINEWTEFSLTMIKRAN